MLGKLLRDLSKSAAVYIAIGAAFLGGLLTYKESINLVSEIYSSLSGPSIEDIALKTIKCGTSANLFLDFIKDKRYSTSKANNTTIFRTALPRSYITVLTDTSNTIIEYQIVSREIAFRPSVRIGELMLQIGKGSFSDLSGPKGEFYVGGRGGRKLFAFGERPFPDTKSMDYRSFYLFYYSYGAAFSNTSSWDFDIADVDNTRRNLWPNAYGISCRVDKLSELRPDELPFQDPLEFLDLESE